jgi:hypothetical protein
MTSESHYKRFAVSSLNSTEGAADLSDKVGLLIMAEAWLDLAEQTVRRSSLISWFRRDMLPAVNSGRVDLLDIDRLTANRMLRSIPRTGVCDLLLLCTMLGASVDTKKAEAKIQKWQPIIEAGGIKAI